MFCSFSSEKVLSSHKFSPVMAGFNKNNTYQGTKIFQYCTCPTGRVTYNFHSSCKHKRLSFKSVCNKEHKGVIRLPGVILPKALVLQDECFGKNYSFLLDFTCNYEQTSGIFVPCIFLHKDKKIRDFVRTQPTHHVI